MALIINLNCGSENQAKVRSDLDLSDKKKPWEQGYSGAEEHAQKQDFMVSLGDKGGIKNVEEKKK